MMANVKLLKPLGTIMVIRGRFFYLFENIFVLVFAGFVPVGIYFSEPQKLNKYDCYILANEGIGRFYRSIIEFEQRILANFIQFK
jgi:hypothetical protein